MRMWCGVFFLRVFIYRNGLGCFMKFLEQYSVSFIEGIKSDAFSWHLFVLRDGVL